jgi:SNF2 family DNA or RNA helicase
MLKEYDRLKRVIIVAPARVIATSWPKEIQQWGFGLSWRWLTNQTREADLQAKPDVLFISSESLSVRNLSETAKAKQKKSQLGEWLVKAKVGGDLLVIDESTKFKTWRSSRTSVIKKMLRYSTNRITLTGTPTPNTLLEVFPQQYLLDQGETLSPYITKFRDQYAQKCGFEHREWEVRPEMVHTLQERISPWYMRQSALEHLDMPELVQNEIEVELPPKAARIYRDMHQKMVAEIEETGIVAIAGSSRYNYCRQIASGIVYYNEDHDTVNVHDAKVEALEALHEELHRKPLIVAYWFQHEGAKLAKKFPDAAVIKGGTSPAETVSIISRWKAGNLPMILVQASAVSHGVDGLQHGGNDLCWFTLTDNPDIRHQLEWRIYRQGVVGQVRIHYLLAKSTVDRTILKTLNIKNSNQAQVLQSVKEMGNETY